MLLFNLIKKRFNTIKGKENLGKNPEVSIYESSLFKYMTHRNPILYIIIVFILYFWLKTSSDKEVFYPLCGIIPIIIYVLLSFRYVKKQLIITKYRIRILAYKTNTEYDEINRPREYKYYSKYEIRNIQRVEETFNRIIIYGDIKHDFSIKDEYPGTINLEKHNDLKKVSIIKDYKDKEKLIEELRSLIGFLEREKIEVKTVEVGCIVKLLNENSGEEEINEIVDSIDYKNTYNYLYTERKVTSNSGRGVALIGKKKGDSIKYQANAGEFKFKILAIYK